jgi:hypothetical protein
MEACLPGPSLGICLFLLIEVNRNKWKRASLVSHNSQKIRYMSALAYRNQSKPMDASFPSPSQQPED